MKHLRIFLFCLLPAAFLALPGRLAAQTPDREDVLRDEVRFLCDSLCAGRGFGTAGAQAATFYLLRQLRDAGLRTTVQSFSALGRVGHNVVAVTPGWHRRYLVVGAYFDAIGTLDGRLYPGADANASGVAALLALARELSQCCRGEVGIVFVAFDGHAADLSGARAFLDRYADIYPPVLMANLDLLGSALAPVLPGRSDYLIALGGERFYTSLEQANRGPRLHLSYDYYGSKAFTDVFYRRVSDQRWFLEAGIPAVMFTSGITEHTNKITDTPATLDFSLLDRRIGLIAAWLRTQL